MCNVKIINQSSHPNPAYQTDLSAGMDLHANIEESISLIPGARILIPTGLFIELPEGHEAQIRPRSGLALKHGITVLNSPGTIEIQNGERIAQMIVAKYERVNWEISTELNSTERGAGGYGSTGVKPA